MIKVKGWDGKKVMVDTCDSDCGSRPCFWLGQDKGSFTPGRGYTSYHKKPLWVCMTRHLHGCPESGICLNCRTIFIPGRKVCSWCRQELHPGGKVGMAQQ